LIYTVCRIIFHAVHETLLYLLTKSSKRLVKSLRRTAKFYKLLSFFGSFSFIE
jgi:hypothetical protein